MYSRTLSRRLIGLALIAIGLTGFLLSFLVNSDTGVAVEETPALSAGESERFEMPPEVATLLAEQYTAVPLTATYDAQLIAGLATAGPLTTRPAAETATSRAATEPPSIVSTPGNTTTPQTATPRPTWTAMPTTAASAPSSTASPDSMPATTATPTETATPMATATPSPSPAPTDTAVPSPEPSATAGPAVNLPESALVLQVIDGMTIEVFLNGEYELVRYIGIETPALEEFCGPEAAAANADLVLAQNVTMLRDRTDRDDEGRLLRYVYLGARLIAAELVRNGWASAVAVEPDITFAADLAALEAVAAGLGCSALPRDATSP